MEIKEQLLTLRNEIDTIDSEIITAFNKRMRASEKVATLKYEGNLSITDNIREKAVIDNAVKNSEEKYSADAAILASTLMALSKRRQQSILLGCEAIEIPEAQKKLDSTALVGYQGVSGAWSEIAALTIYPEMARKNYEYFEDVFAAVRKGEIAYGIVPIENSQTGAIGEIYDLLRSYGCYIVAGTRVEIKHCLMAKPGVKINEIKEVFSHPEGFNQCRNYLKKHNFEKTACRNTAIAAETVAASGEKAIAAIGSPKAAENNGLEILARDITDKTDNKTRFIAIAAKPEYDESSNTVSVTFSTAHRSGALCGVLQAFMSAGLNLTRIESRPVSGGKYRFFADLEANILDEGTKNAFSMAAAMSEYFEFLGCYHD